MICSVLLQHELSPDQKCKMEVQLGSRNTSLLFSIFCGTFLCIQQLSVRGSMFHFSAYIWHL